MSESELLFNTGKRIRYARLNKKMTQGDLAEICKFEKARVSRIENGQANLTIRSIHKICEALDIKIADLFCE